MDNSDSFFDGRMLIDGQMLASESGAWLDSIDPADESVIGRMPLGSAADMNAAVAAAKRAQIGWARTSIPDRVARLNKLADAIEKSAAKIARLEARDTGNLLGPMHKDVLSAAERIRFAAGYGYEVKGFSVPGVGNNLHFTTRVPYGVVGRIVAFNHPFGFAAARISSVLISGNTMVIKPSEQSPLSASLLGELCAEHLPAGVVNIVTGGRETGEALVRHPDVKRIAFIGSVPAGRAIQKAAAETAVKHVSLELGGKNPLIAFPDVDLHRVADAAVAGMNFSWQGQSCGSTSRLLLHKDIYQEVTALVLERVARIKLGHPLDASSSMGPINSLGHYRKVMSYIELGPQEGAELIAGGKRPEGRQFEKGYWVMPTVFRDVRPEMRLAREEVFGPVLSIMRFDTEEQAIDIANSVEFGLTAAVWSRDIDRALRVAAAVQAGYVWVNGVGTHYRNMPYGGMKNSGVGREEGLADILGYTEEKSVNILVSDAS
ncbi:MAG: aldehyde dehydrogenase family protein [Burkholderiales bacterium]|nr:aldehyde dehydrogenase family protein [Burkholderiales bacterium]